MAHPEMKKFFGIPPLVIIEYGPENFNSEGVLTCMLLTMHNRNYKMCWKHDCPSDKFNLVKVWREVGREILKYHWYCRDILDETFVSVGAKFIFKDTTWLDDVIEHVKNTEIGFHEAIGIAKAHFKNSCNFCINEIRTR